MPYVTVIEFVAYDPLPAADLNSNFSNLDYLNTKINEQFILTASGMSPSSTNGAAGGTAEMSTNKNNYNFMDFSNSGGKLYAEVSFPMPEDYGGGTITALFHWTANSTSTNSVRWGIQAACVADNEALDVAFGTAQEVTDANKSTAYKLSVSAETPAVTIAGTPVAGELVVFRLYRDSANAGDDLAATARLLAVVINYTRT